MSLNTLRIVFYSSFQMRLSHCVGTITSMDKIQSNTTYNICSAKSFFYIACLNNDMFRPLYRPSSGCTLSYYKANYTTYIVFVFVNKISCTSVKFAFKIITLAVELKSYSTIKGINSIKSLGVVISAGGVRC